MTFEDLNLNKPLLNALADLSYTTPTPIQRKVFSVVMSGKDVCGIAQTGTGKTFAYLLPSLRQFQFSKDRSPQLLIIVPTRELVVQVVEAVQQLSKYTTLTVVGLYGGVNIKPQIAEVEKGMDVLVSTPGRLIDLSIKGLLKTKSIKRLVIDEVDEMLNLGFRTQLETILDLLPAKRQNLLFSATMTEEVETLIQTYFNSPARVEASPVGTPLENIQQSAYEVPNFYTKVNLLEALLYRDEEMNRVLVFVATKELANLLYDELIRELPDQVGVIHSNKEQNYRFNAVRQFQDGTYRVLIATDIIARGLDIAEVSHVVNFDLPETPESYIHRIGRTGRADKNGIAIAFVTEKQKEQREAIEELMNYRIPMLPLPKSLEISDELIDDEKPKSNRKQAVEKIHKSETFGGAFHEKSEKNKKVNVRRDHAKEMMKKYGKPIKKTRKNN
ncbi:ATP-dependent RNA helicase RhlE [Larkinella arboricola]|uniref:ATP-dependent RNA helicase RhlE n=1 Tax=Larkinella arboricola TaxID=643671 RepID=A0A327WUP0_LARAB|nr:DEAD/DEAH box helicase [Larkinella arboricola]RAJ95777.1 ATP-dependent RNA helicase RhlE [Larkinella arboricola]